MKDDDHMTTMMMMRMMRIEVMILMNLTRTMTPNQRLTTRRKKMMSYRNKSVGHMLKKHRLRRRFALNSFTFLQIQVWPGKKLNANGLMYLTS